MKKLLIIIGALLAVLIAAAMIAPSFISSDNIKAQLIEKVHAATGRTLTIDGNLRLKFFPIAGITADKVTLSNPPGFADNASFITLQSLSVEVGVLPLLHHNIAIHGLVLDEPQINFHVDKNGNQNWAFGQEKSGGEGAKPSTAAPSSPSNDALAALGSLSLNGVEIKNATIHYINDSNKSRLDLLKLNASLSMNGLNSPLSISGDGEWNSKTVKVSAKASSLAGLMNATRSDIQASISSDLFSVETSGYAEKSTYVGKGDIKSPSLTELMAWAGPAAKAAPAGPKLAFTANSDMNCGAGYCNLPHINLSLDKLQGNGSVKVTLTGEKPAIDLNLTTALLDFNPFLPPQQHAAISDGLVADAMADSGHWSDAPIDLSGLQAANVTASIKTDHILYRKIAIGKTVFTAKLLGGHLTADITDAEMYSGKGSISAVVDGSVSPPAIQLNTTLKGVQLEPLLKDAAITDRLSGTGDMQISTMGRGASQRAIIASLAGSGQIRVANGVLKGVNLGDMAHNLQTAFQKTDDDSQKTVFTDMGGTFTISQGVVSNNDLTMNTTGLRLTGKGTVNLPAYTISYRLTPQIISTATDQTTGKTTEKQGLAVPVVVEGSLDKPSYRPDVGAVLQNALQDPKQFRQQLKNSNSLKGLLKGLGN